MKIVIIGNGISGITAARHIRKMSDHALTVISAESDYFYSRTALMYIYMGHMRYEHTKPYEDWFWEKNNITLVRNFVEEIDTDGKVLYLKDRDTISYDILIVATGSKPNKFGWPGQDLKGVQGLYSLQDLDTMEKFTRNIGRAVIVGGGLIGIEATEMLQSRNIPVTLLIREEEYWDNVLPKEEAQMVSRHVTEHKVDLRKRTPLKEVLGDGDGRVKAVVTEPGEVIPCQFVILSPGVSPNIDIVRKSNIATGLGVLVNEYFETSQPGVYAIGDCAEFNFPLPGRKPVEQLWYTGKIHGEVLAYNLCREKIPYKPGVWFNSAKFLDIEYQVYGAVSSRPDGEEAHFYWEHPGGKASLRIAFRKDSRQVTGFNLMGIRFRQETCERWIKEKAGLREVVSRLHLANFDPEFSERHEPRIIEHYNRLFSDDPVRVKRKKKLLGLFSAKT